MKKTILRQQERTIQENRQELLLLEKNKVDIMNEVARANHEIDELKTRLARKDNLLKHSQDLQDTLLLQAEKLRFEKEQLNQRCDNVINEMQERLRVKENAIGQVREEIDKYSKLQKEVKQRNDVLKGRLEKRGSCFAPYQAPSARLVSRSPGPAGRWAIWGETGSHRFAQELEAAPGALEALGAL